MPTGSARGLQPEPAPFRSLFVNVGKADDAARRSPSPHGNQAFATRRPDRPGMNIFTVSSKEPPPAYTTSPSAPYGPAFEYQIPELAAPTPPQTSTPALTTPGGEDPYSFLSTFDTTLLIDDSSSMTGRS
ncbi:hypothetical protein LZ554_000003 [Drepanopeziza brunnea f. sp. 'monogermtubi']|nr:hypothetical protein LZ554_000003 [Drepanopeziza brunnea f. sp. 'monogermtubi']